MKKNANLLDSLTPEVIEKFRVVFMKKALIKKNDKTLVKTLYKDQETFDQFMNDLCKKYNDSWVDFEYSNGRLPQPNNLLTATINLFQDEGIKLNESFDDFTKQFPAEISDFMNWQIALIHGQGTIVRIYKNKKEKITI